MGVPWSKGHCPPKAQRSFHKWDYAMSLHVRNQRALWLFLLAGSCWQSRKSVGHLFLGGESLPAQCFSKKSPLYFQSRNTLGPSLLMVGFTLERPWQMDHCMQGSVYREDRRCSLTTLHSQELYEGQVPRADRCLHTVQLNPVKYSTTEFPEWMALQRSFLHDLCRVCSF